MCFCPELGMPLYISNQTALPSTDVYWHARHDFSVGQVLHFFALRQLAVCFGHARLWLCAG